LRGVAEDVLVAVATPLLTSDRPADIVSVSSTKPDVKTSVESLNCTLNLKPSPEIGRLLIDDDDDADDVVVEKGKPRALCDEGDNTARGMGRNPE
jgi:hypothetical protein